MVNTLPVALKDIGHEVVLEPIVAYDMKTSHEVLLVSNINELCVREVTIGYSSIMISEKNPLGTRALFKCCDISISEVFGYLLAKLLGVPVLRFQAVWFDKEAMLPNGYQVPVGNLGVLIEFLPNLRQISLETLASRDKKLTANLLVFYFFDRYEWPEIRESGTSLCVLDLERIGPVMEIDEFACECRRSLAASLQYREREYVQMSQDASAEVLAEAKNINVLTCINDEFARISQISPADLQHQLTIKGHPLSPLLSAFFQSAVSRRQGILSDKMGFPSWPVVDWESRIDWEFGR
jgi:hypothetical protein